MKIMIQAPDFTVSDSLKLFVETKIIELETYTRKIIRAEVILGEDYSEVGDIKFCRIRLVTEKNMFLVAHYSEAFEESVSTAADHLRRDISALLPSL